MGVAIGSSIQISLLVTPALVILGWIMHQPMSLHFELCKRRAELSQLMLMRLGMAC